ncbi:MAG: endoribonuclease MazF [Bacillota bacterium]|nr:endoribonuclease MazF [Bacillota bacterium]MDI7250373.1 endoribonuclease MazF [Bacillota bacterium]
MASRYVPDRGDVVWLTFHPQAGHEQSGRRPAVTISPRAYNGKTNLGIFCPVTSQVKGYPYEVRVPAGVGVTGVILSDQVKSLDWEAREAEFICTLPEQTLSEILAKLRTLIS